MADKVARLAELAHLSVVAQGGVLGAACAAGPIDGYPVAAAWTRRQKKSTLACLVRFAAGSAKLDNEALKARLEAAPPLLEAMGKKPDRPARLELRIAKDGVLLYWDFQFAAPKPEQAEAVLRALVGSIKDVAAPVGGACDVCGGRGGGELGCMGGALVSICSGCRERIGEEDRRAREEYEARPSRPLAGIAAGLVVSAAGAILWGVVAFALHRIFLMGAIGIGIAVAWAVDRGMGKVNHLGRAVTMALTVASVMAGDFVFIFLNVARNISAPPSIDLARQVAATFIDIEFTESNGWMTLVFALVGAGYILYVKRGAPVARREFVRVGA
jgi:hypothetical protein